MAEPTAAAPADGEEAGRGSTHEGIATIAEGGGEHTLAWVAYGVLALSAVIEGTSWLQSVRRIRAADAVAGPP